MQLTIGPLTLTLNGLEATDIPVNSRMFLSSPTAEADICYHFHTVESLPQPDHTWERSFERPDIVVYQKGGLEARRLAVGKPDAAYAHYQERNEKEMDVYVLHTLKQELAIDTIFVSCLALERHLTQRGCYILHSCFLNYHGQAILFSGQSGIGKSTHADLWCRFLEGAHVVNGDRSLICPDGYGGYKACGWPVCGSSNICHLEELPLKAIVFMGQAPHNEVVKVRPMQLFKQLSSQVTINWWNKQQVSSTLDALQQMQVQVPMCNYACNLTEEAPETLHNYLKERQWIS